MVVEALFKSLYKIQVAAMLVYDDIFDWTGWGGKLKLGSGKCRLRIFDLKKDSGNGPTHLRPMLILVTDIPESPISIRSCAGHVATKVIKTFNIDPHRMLFIEYHPATTYGEKSDRIIPERYETIAFEWHDLKAIQPTWRILKPPILDLVKRLVREFPL